MPSCPSPHLPAGLVLLILCGFGLLRTQHGAMPWTSDRQRRTLLYRYAARGFSTGLTYEKPSWAAELSPLTEAIMEPPHINARPDIAALVAEEEEEEAGGG